MTDQRNAPASSPAKTSGSGGLGCLLGLGIAIAFPVVVFCGILIANTMNPQCGTPADSGGCEMGLAAGTIVAVVIGLAAGVLVAILVTVAGRPARRAAPLKSDSDMK